MPRVLVLCEHGSLNGGERSLLAVIQRLRLSGFDLTVVGPPHGLLADAIRDLSVSLVPFEVRGSEHPRRSQAELREELQAVLADNLPDLVHANSLSMSRLSGPVTSVLGIPSVGHLRDIMQISDAAVGDLNRHTRLLAVSNAVQDWYLASGLVREKTFVLYNGVDLQRFRPRAPTGYLCRQLQLPQPARLVVSVGQISLRKGLDVLEEAARTVLVRQPDVHFLVVGRRYSQKQETIEYEAELRRAAGSPPLAGRFHFLGERNDVKHLLAEAELLAHPARQEPLGRVLLEAAATGTPVVATSVGGTTEIFPADSAAAKLVPPDDSAEMAEAILEILADQALARRMAKAGRGLAEIKFDANESADQLGRHYLEVLDQAARH